METLAAHLLGILKSPTLDTLRPLTILLTPKTALRPTPSLLHQSSHTLTPTRIRRPLGQRIVVSGMCKASHKERLPIRQQATTRRRCVIMSSGIQVVHTTSAVAAARAKLAIDQDMRINIPAGAAKVSLGLALTGLDGHILCPMSID